MNEKCPGGQLEPIVSPQPPELLDLVRFLCATWAQIDEWAYKHADGDALMQYPVIQGTSNQMRLRRIGAQGYDSRALQAAMEWMLRANAQVKGAPSSGVGP